MEGLVMQRDLLLPLPDRPLPHDVTITTWQAAVTDQFFQAYHNAFRERPGFPGLSAAEWIFGNNDEDNFRTEWSLLAQEGEAPVGFVTASSKPPHGFVIQIGVIPGWRRRGLASALLVETMRRMQADGAASTQLTVHTNNPEAIAAYTRLGFATVGRRARYERIVER
jgi:ribosomal protein S18 acetylase RimI-like enzyme